jgi:hypothetical protein
MRRWWDCLGLLANFNLYGSIFQQRELGEIRVFLMFRNTVNLSFGHCFSLEKWGKFSMFRNIEMGCWGVYGFYYWLFMITFILVVPFVLLFFGFWLTGGERNAYDEVRPVF